MRRIQNVPLLEKVHQKRGSVFHQIVEDYLKGGSFLLHSEDKDNKLHSLACAGMPDLPEPCREVKDLGIEQEFKFKDENGITYASAIDAVDWQDGEIQDFKTYAKKEYLPTSTKREFDVQLAMYCFYYFLMKPEEDMVLFRWLYFHKGTSKRPISYLQTVTKQRAIRLMFIYGQIAQYMLQLAAQPQAPPPRLTACPKYGWCKAWQSCGIDASQRLEAFLLSETPTDEDPFEKIKTLYERQFPE